MQTFISKMGLKMTCFCTIDTIFIKLCRLFPTVLHSSPRIFWSTCSHWWGGWNIEELVYQDSEEILVLLWLISLPWKGCCIVQEGKENFFCTPIGKGRQKPVDGDARLYTRGVRDGHSKKIAKLVGSVSVSHFRFSTEQQHVVKELPIHVSSFWDREIAHTCKLNGKCPRSQALCFSFVLCPDAISACFRPYGVFDPLNYSMYISGKKHYLALMVNSLFYCVAWLYNRIFRPQVV